MIGGKVAKLLKRVEMLKQQKQSQQRFQVQKKQTTDKSTWSGMMALFSKREATELIWELLALSNKGGNFIK